MEEAFVLRYINIGCRKMMMMIIVIDDDDDDDDDDDYDPLVMLTY